MTEMKTLLVIAGLMAVVTATPVAEREPQITQRFYDPKEDMENRVSYFLWEDESGLLHVEDLEKEPEAVIISRFGGNEGVTIYLYTKNNKFEGDVVFSEDGTTLSKSKNFDAKKKNVFLIHGWNNDYKSPINTELTRALLTVYDVNVFVVDWSQESYRFYTTAKNAVPRIGKTVGMFINEMMKTMNLSSHDFSIIGHSLGAHVAGCAGAVIEPKIDYIVGLDPASPLFTLKNTDNRLDTTDAAFVQIIHTNGGLLGFNSAIGTADYYPNGGSRQPGCGLDIAGSCAHSRSYLYLAESIYESAFSAHLCSNFRLFDRGECFKNQKSYLGGFNIDKRAYGDYYLVTGNKQPYARKE